MANNNKITTKSYTLKRLRDCGYGVDKLDDIIYNPEDSRKWSILIDNGCSSVLLTCYKDSSIHLYDGGRFLNSRIRSDTDSVEVLVEYLNTRGIVNKHWSYGTRYKDDTES